MDPWEWTVDEVVHNLCYSDTLYAARPSSVRPNGAKLDHVLRENHVDGATLMTDVDLNALKSDFGLKSFGERSLIKHAIDVLRTQSSKYLSHRATVASQSYLPDGDARTISPAPTPPQTIPVKRRRSPTPKPVDTPRARPGEVLVEDAAGGRKRRRLELHPPRESEQPPIRAPSKDYFGLTKQPVDDLFFEKMSRTSAVEGLAQNSDSESDEFALHGKYGIPRAQKLFVNRRMRHFLQSEPVSIDDTCCIKYPYSSRFADQGRARYAILFTSFDRKVQVSKRDAAMLDHPVEDQVGDNHDWDFLTKWTKNCDKDVVYGPLGESDEEDGAYEGSILSEIEQEEAEKKARAAKNGRVLGKDAVAIVVDTAVRDLEQQWNEYKLPKRQQKAWSVWRKARGYQGRLRIEAARREIARLDARIEKIKASICDEVWYTVEQIQKQCVCMEVTVFERQEQQWYIQLWDSQQPPPRPATQPRKPQTKKEVPADAEEESLASDTEVESMKDFVYEDFDYIDDVYEPHDALDRLHTSQDHVRMVEGADAVRTSRSPGDDTAKVQDRNKSSLDDRQSASPDAEQETSSLGDRSSDEESANSRDGSVDSVLDLVAASPQTPVKSRTNPPRPSDIIDLTASSPSAASPQGNSADDANNVASANVSDDDFDSHPEHASEAEIAGWEWDKLEETSDRKRIVLKLLLPLDEQLRRNVDSNFLPTADRVLKRKVQLALGGIGRDDKQVADIKPAEAPAVNAIARIYVCWNDANHRHYLGGISGKPLKSALLAKGFEDFYKFVKSIVKTANDTDDEDPNSPRKKRKRQVLKSRQGEGLREAAQRRRVEGEERYEKWKSSLQSKGLSESTNGITINPTKADDEDFIYINEHIAAKIKPHQVDGIRFMWRELVAIGESVQQGCLLAHTMGLGKTMQTITLLVTLAEAGASEKKKIISQIPDSLRASRTLILCPAILIENWKEEFTIWQPEETQNVGYVYHISAGAQLKDERLLQISKWYERGGVMIMGYEMFQSLIANKPRKKTAPPPLDPKQHQLVEMQLLEGPNIVVADEAHRLKNKASGITIMANRFTTTSRIALTGSPLANNLGDYYAMIDWVAPKYLGDPVEFRTYYQEPIEAGTYADSSAAEQRKSLKKLHALKMDIDPKVHRKDISVLQHELKKKTEFVIKLPLTKLQTRAYSVFVNSLLHKTNEDIANTRLMAWMSVLGLLCNHPSTFLEKLRNRDANQGPKPKALKQSSNEEEPDISDLELSATMIQSQEDIFHEEAGLDVEDIRLSHKTAVVQQILAHSKRLGDKVLIFTHSIPTLKYLERCISKMKDLKLKTAILCGDIKMLDRLQIIKQFNSGKYDALLISTRAGSLGLNILGANRVILMDFSWNPSWEEQGVGRAYRIGQPKPVYVYHLLTAGTFEERLHHITIFKRQLAARVVEGKKPKRAAAKVNEMLFEPHHVPQEDLEQHKGLDLVMDSLLESEAGKAVRGLSTAETLHAESNEALTEEELKEVAIEMEDDKLRKTDPGAWNQKRIMQQSQLLATRPVPIPQASNGLPPFLGTQGMAKPVDHTTGQAVHQQAAHTPSVAATTIARIKSSVGGTVEALTGFHLGMGGKGNEGESANATPQQPRARAGEVTPPNWLLGNSPPDSTTPGPQDQQSERPSPQWLHSNGRLV